MYPHPGRGRLRPCLRGDGVLRRTPPRPPPRDDRRVREDRRASRRAPGQQLTAQFAWRPGSAPAPLPRPVPLPRPPLRPRPVSPFWPGVFGGPGDLACPRRRRRRGRRAPRWCGGGWCGWGWRGWGGCGLGCLRARGPRRPGCRWRPGRRRCLGRPRWRPPVTAPGVEARPDGCTPGVGQFRGGLVLRPGAGHVPGPHGRTQRDLHPRHSAPSTRYPFHPAASQSRNQDEIAQIPGGVVRTARAAGRPGWPPERPGCRGRPGRRGARLAARAAGMPGTPWAAGGQVGRQSGRDAGDALGGGGPGWPPERPGCRGGGEARAAARAAGTRGGGEVRAAPPGWPGCRGRRGEEAAGVARQAANRESQRVAG